MKESEGRSMKNDIEWLKEAIGELDLVDTVFDVGGVSYIDTAVRVMQVYDLIDQLDEPEVLSQEWINDNKEMYLINDTSENAVPDYKLQNLLVPEQEELEAKIQELIESYKQEEGAYSNPENGWISGFIEDLKNLVEKEQKYYILGKYDTPILFRDHRNRITETSNLNDIYPKANSEDFEFTEQEIKDYDPRYWAFAEPVE